MENSTAFYSALKKWIAPGVKRYARLDIKGLENLPDKGKGALLACNHSGSLWWDALCLIAASERPVSFVAHHWDAQIGAMRKVLEAAGCGFLDEHMEDIHAHSNVVEGAKAGQLMCLYPEESYHSFQQRYTLFRFSPQVIKYAELAEVPIIPVTIIGAEEAAPTLFGPKLKKVPLHIPAHLPFILPFKVTVEFGKPLTLKDLLGDVPSHLSTNDYQQAADQLRQIMFDTLKQYRPAKLSDERYIEKSGWV